jgi:tetratricopeptide (TPR) repeat protein
MSQSPNPAAPHEVAPLLALATELLRAGRPADAIAPLRNAALLQPSNPIIQHDLGLACLEVGRVPDALAALERAVASNPRYTDAYFRLGIALEKLGNIGGAIVAYDRATELQPSLTEAWFRAGALVYTLGHRDEAIGCFRRAAATGGKASFGRLGKARALLIEDRNQEAERVLRHTLALDPGNAMAHDLLGNLLSEFGRFDEAHECFQRAIAIAPLLAGSYYDLVRCRPVTSDDDGLLQRMEAALATPGLEAAQRLRLHLAIGKAADDLGDYALAMQHFDAADAVRRGSTPFDSPAFSIEIDRLIARCTPELIARARELGSSDTTPVLIIGMPRSGTTLVEQIVSMHPEVGAGGELNFWNERGAVWHRSGAAGNEKPFFAKAAADYLGVLRDRAESGASDRQDAVQLPLGRADPCSIPARNHHPLSPRCSRHSAVDPSNSFPSGPAVSDRRCRTGRVFPQLSAAHQPLAERAACESLHRGRLRGPDPRARTSHPPDHRGLRSGVGRRVPAPRMQSTGCEDPQQVADPAADLSQLRRALATLRTLAGAPARAPRRRIGTGREYRPIVIGLKPPTSPERHEDNVHETA